MKNQDAALFVRVPSDLIRDLDDLARIDSTTRSKMTRRILDEYAERRRQEIESLPRA